MKKLNYIILNILPIILMIGLIPMIKNDYLLALIYIVIIILSLIIHREPKDFSLFILGFIALTISETIFISTGVETFTRRTLFNLMPIWLPILWGYGFIAIKRAVLII
jgi:hypothetical protein